MDNNDTSNISGNVTISTGTTLQNHSVLYVGGNWLNNGTFTENNGTVFFDGTGTQTVSATTFNNLNINKPVGTSAILTGNISIKGDLTLMSGTFNIMSFDCNRATLGGNITLADASTFIISANNAPTNFSNGTVADSSTVIADGTGPQAIFGVDFGNLIFRNGGAKTLVSPITVNGNLTIEAGSNFDADSNTITLNGNWINNGTFTPSSSTLILSGTDKTVSGNTTFNKLTIPGSYINLSDITYNDLLHITSTGSISSDTGIFTTLHGDLINNGVLYTLGTTTFTGNAVQTLRLINAVQTLALIVNFNGSVSPVLNSTSAPQFGYLNINNTGGVNPSVDWTVLYDLTVGSGASFNCGSHTHFMYGGVTNNGTITSSGVLNFLPASAAAVNLGTNFTSTGEVNFGGTGAMTLSGSNLDSFHNVTFSNTNVAGISPSFDWNISNACKINSGSILNAGNHSFLVGGNITNNGTINSGTSTFTLNGIAAQDIYSLSPFNNLTISNTADSVTISSDVTVNSVLNFIAGKIQTGFNKIIQPSPGTVTGAAQNTGWVNGKFQKNVATGATTKSFAIGDATSFTPVTIAFSNVTTAGDLTVFTTPGDHPNIVGSGINPSQSVNRFWTLTNSGVGFTDYTGTYNFATADVDGGANTAAFSVANYNGTAWTLPVTASPNPTNIQSTGVTGFGDVAVGEICNKNTAISYVASPYCSNAGSASVTLSGNVGGTYSSSSALSLESIYRIS